MVSTSLTDTKDVTVECGNTPPVKTKVIVIPLNNLTIQAKRSAPINISENTFFDLIQNEHMEIGGTFNIRLNMTDSGGNTWPLPNAHPLKWQIWDIFGVDTKLIENNYSSPFTHIWADNSHPGRRIRIYFDVNNNGAHNFGEPEANTISSFLVIKKKNHSLTFGRSYNAILKDVPEICIGATERLIKKETSDDYRAATLVTQKGTVGVITGGTDPIHVEQKQPNWLQNLLGATPYVVDTWGEQAHFINAGYNVTIVSGINVCDSNKIIIGEAAGLSPVNYKYQIFVIDSILDGGVLAHELGHACGIAGDYRGSSEINNIMYYSTAGDGNLLKASEASYYE